MRPVVRRPARLLRPAARASRALRAGCAFTVVGWHRVDSHGGELSTPTDVFRRQLDALEQWGAAVLSLDEATRLCAAGASPDRAIVLTFDDGYASAVETAWPLLRERKLPATLFVVTGYLDGTSRFPWDAAERSADRTRLATAQQILGAAADGLDVGSHTVTHRWLPHLGAHDLNHELADSRVTLEGLLGRKVQSLAYPMGGWDATARAAAARAGYAIGVTVDRGLNAPRQDPLALRRSIAPNTVADFELMLDGALTWLRPLDVWRTRKGPRW
jgi:peptidoglycan/xylan/chitin deacetylase (PgdA/CDA1 family)